MVGFQAKRGRNEGKEKEEKEREENERPTAADVRRKRVANDRRIQFSFFQNKKQVLSDVRAIISEQLGTELEKVRSCCARKGNRKERARA